MRSPFMPRPRARARYSPEAAADKSASRSIVTPACSASGCYKSYTLPLRRPRIRSVPRTVALVVEELAHALGAASLFVLQAHFLALGLQIVSRLLVRNRPHVLDGYFCRLKHFRVELHQPLRQRHCLFAQLIARDGLVNQPDFLGHLAVEGLAGHRQPHSVA